MATTLEAACGAASCYISTCYGTSTCGALNSLLESVDFRATTVWLEARAMPVVTAGAVAHSQQRELENPYYSIDDELP